MKIKHNKFYNFQLKKVDKNIPLFDYNILKEDDIWKNNKFLFKKGFGNDILNLKNERNKNQRPIQLERTLDFKLILNNFNRNFNKKFIDTLPLKLLFNPPIYYNYRNSSKLLKSNSFKLKNFREERRINKNHINKDYSFEQHEKLNLFNKENFLSHLNESYLFFKKKKNKSINPLIKIFNKDITIKKRELNSHFNQRINMIKNNSMRELKTKKLNI